jgi:hypothetical protein
MRRPFAFVLVLCVCTVPAAADMTVTETAVNPGLVTSINSYPGYYSGGVYTGVYKLAIAGSTTPGLPNGSVDAFCIDICQFSPSGQVYSVASLDAAPVNTDAGPMGELRARSLATLLDRYWVAWSPSGNVIGGSPGTYTDDQAAAAVQLAVWEIVAEFKGQTLDRSGWTVSPVTGRQFSATSSDGSVISLANWMLEDIASVAADGLSSYKNYRALSNDRQQDYVVRVPVADAILLGLLGLGAAGLKLRKFA